jgi:hypothetical protein
MSVHPIKPRAKKVAAPAVAPLREEHVEVLSMILAFGAFTPHDDLRIKALAYGVWAIFLRTPFAENHVVHLEKHGLITPHKGVIPWRLTAHGEHVCAQLPVPR